MARWMYSDAVQCVVCPRCHQAAGKTCRQPSGRRAPEVHGERVAALQALPDFNINDYCVTPVNITRSIRK